MTWENRVISTTLEEEGEEASGILVTEIDLQRVKSLKKKLNVPLEIGHFYTPRPVQEHPGERPYFPEAFVAAERKNFDFILHH